MTVRFLLVVSLALAGCGVSASQQPARPVGLLPAAAVPWLSGATHPLSASDVAKSSTIPSLASRLRSWGYLSGWERTFQGESHRLTLVDDQSLVFRANAGAVAFVGYMRDHLAGFYPFAATEPFAGGWGSGSMFEPPECACHMANPALVGVAASGQQVRWLEINGPLATPRALRLLFAKIPSARS